MELQRARSCSCPGLDVSSWLRISSRRRPTGRRYSDDYSDEEEEVFGGRQMSYQTGIRSLGAKWKDMWKRIVKEKRKVLNSAAPMHSPYNQYTYAQNFDEGSALVEPENLSHSFSARFAAPLRRRNMNMNMNMMQRVA